MSAKVLMVDVDGVLVNHPQPGGWACNLQRDLGLAKEELQQRFFQPHFDDVVHGRARLRDRLAPVLADIAPHLSCDELIAYWFREDAHLDHDLLQQLDSVRSSGFEIHLATIQEHERAAYLWNVLRLRDHCDAMHYAAVLGASKPAPEFFAAIEARSGFAPSSILFIDDKAANVEAAQRRGWDAAVWIRGAQLHQLLPALMPPRARDRSALGRLPR